LVISLIACELVLSAMPPAYAFYSSVLGTTGLTVEATLALPQILANSQAKSCKGFRVSVLASWLIGDAMKLFWFFTSPNEIPFAFKACGIFQSMCDCFLGLQYFMYGDGGSDGLVKEHPKTEGAWPSTFNMEMQEPTRSMSPRTRLHTSTNGAEVE
jgi:solute carrier family 66, member 2